MKQAIVARTDLGMGEGKLAAQVAHASLKSYEKAGRRAKKRWKKNGQKKIVLKASGEEELYRLAEDAKRMGLPYAIVRDAGHTQLDPGTTTTLGIGPASEEAIDGVTGDCSLY